MSGSRADLVAQSRLSIQRGSKSFAAASTLFGLETRERAWLLYAWCRRCDDLADDQDMGGALGDQAGAAERLEQIRNLTARAFAGEPAGDPAFDAFGLVARECGITPAMADDVIAGFALDAADWRPGSEGDLMRYCFHVAGAVGVMMALVMGVSPADDDTLDRACDLGLAFQLANIARDLAEDANARRCYLPADWLAEEGIPAAQLMDPAHRAALVRLAARLADMAERHEAAARIGAARLAFRQRWAVLAAARIYGQIAREVRRRGAQAWDQRVHSGGWAKLGHVAVALVQALLPTPTLAVLPRWQRRDLMALAHGQTRIVGLMI